MPSAFVVYNPNTTTFLAVNGTKMPALYPSVGMARRFMPTRLKGVRTASGFSVYRANIVLAELMEED